ncbi:MAG: hypothetical protein R6V61_13255 [Wenzhouxiangellaceae bacterium]
MNRKPDQRITLVERLKRGESHATVRRAALARVDARKLSNEFEAATEDVEWFSDWRNQLAFYREQADHLADRIETESGAKAGPRAILHWQIEDAEKAAKAGDLGRYGLHIGAIVTTLVNAQMPTIQQATRSDSQSERAKKPRPQRQGTLRRVLDSMSYTDANDAIQQWIEQPETGGYQLRFVPEHDKPFIAGDEAFSEKQIRQKVSAIKASEKQLR